MSDFSLTTFSAKGKLPQIENALTAVSKGQTAIGIKTLNGVVLVCEKKMPSPLMDESTVNKMQNLAAHAGAVYAGIGPDYRLLCQRSRKIVNEYVLKYDEEIAVQSLCRDIATLVQEKTQSGGYRPFGVSMLVAGRDEKGPHLFQIDPSGAYYAWKATAIGKGAKNAKAILERRYGAGMEIEDGIHTALLTLKQNFEGEMGHENIEVGVIRADGPFVSLSPKQVKDYIEELQ